MVHIGIDCLLKNTDLHAKLKELIPVYNSILGAKHGNPSFRQVYNKLLQVTGVELDLDSFAKMYKSEIPSDFRFTSDNAIESILNRRTKIAFDELINGTVDRLDKIGETATDRAAIHKVASILTTIEEKDNSVRTKTMARKVKDAVLASIQRLANNNEKYKELKKSTASKETYEETVQRLLDLQDFSVEQSTADRFNTVQDVIEQARKTVLQSMDGLVDEDGEPLLGEEAEKFLDQYKNAFFGVLMSTEDANTIIRGALMDKGFKKGSEGNEVVDWKKLAGEINSPNVLRENVIDSLKEGVGLTQEAAESIADSLTSEFTELVQGQKAMDIKYSIAETEAEDILKRLGQVLPEETIEKINDSLKAEINKSVEESDELNIGEIVNDVLHNVAKISKSQLSNLPDKGLIVKQHTVDRISNLIKDDDAEDLDAESIAKLYGILGKAVDPDTINELKKLADLKDKIENIEVSVQGGDDKLVTTKQGVEKAKLIQNISDEMARIVARSADYTDRSVFYKYMTYALNALSKLLSASSAMVLVNPFNIVQNLSAGRTVSLNAKIGGNVGGNIKTPLFYEPKDEQGDLILDKDGKAVKVNLDELLNKVTIGETWWNNFIGARGRDIPDLFTGDVSKEAKTFTTAETKIEYAEAVLTALPRAALTATDAMLKEPYFRQELIRGVLYHLQASGGKTKQQALDMVYKALTKNSVENLMKEAGRLAEMLGKGNDKYFIKQVAEDIQMSSLVLMEQGEDGIWTSVLSEDNLKAIMDAAKQTSGESFGHISQKDVWGLPWLFKLMTNGKSLAIESMNKEHGNKMAEYYKTGKYMEAAWSHFAHTALTNAAFLFQRGIYNWAVLLSQRNPLSIWRGFSMLSKETNFNDAKGTQDAVENYLRARAKMGRGVSGTVAAFITIPLVMAALGSGDDDERKRRLAALRKDPVWGRVYRNIVGSSAQAFIDMRLSDNITEGAATGLKDLFIQPVVSAGAKYFSTDALLIKSVENMSNGKFEVAGKDFGQAASIFLPGKGFLNTNKAWVERFGKESPKMVDENWQIVADDRKPEKKKDFWDAFGY